VDLRKRATVGEGAAGAGSQISRTLVAELLDVAKFGLQGDRTIREGDSIPTGMRDSPICTFKWPQRWAEKQPVVSVDIKKATGR
jgi:hypothetical protein